MMYFKSVFFLGLAIVALCTAGAKAQIVDLTNGDWETSAANGNGSFPAPWYSGNPGGWNEFRFAGLGGYTGTAAAFGSEPGGYFYQNVGTYAGEASVTAAGTAYNRSDNGNPFGDFDVAFYYTAPAAFAPAEGTDVATLGTLIDSVQEFQEGVNLPGLTSGTTATSSDFSFTALFAGSGIAAGDEVWVRFGESDSIFGGNTASAFDEPFIDDLSVSATAAEVPEPTAISMWLIAGSLLMGCSYFRTRRSSR